jgi:hypothetical protein
MSIAVFWVVAACSLVEVYRRFRGACCFHHQDDMNAASIIRAMSLIVLMIEAANTSETSVKIYQATRRNNPEDSHLHTHRRENLKSYHSSTLLHYFTHPAPSLICIVFGYFPLKSDS